MWVSKYFVYFIIYSCFGWIYETILCTIRSGRWDNRGFLYGPVCPIYGAGGVSITMIVDWLSENGGAGGYTWQQVFLISFFGSIVLEYATSWCMEKLFHAYWWDYSDLPFNINGRVCLPCSIGFGCAGLFVVYVAAPFVRNITETLSPPGYEFLGLIFMAFISIDTTLTVCALTDFEKTVETMEENLNAHMEQFVETAVDRIAEERERFSQESMERAFRPMGISARAALRRVKGFRGKGKVDMRHMDAALAHIKKRMAEARDKRHYSR